MKGTISIIRPKEGCNYINIQLKDELAHVPVEILTHIDKEET